MLNMPLLTAGWANLVQGKIEITFYGQSTYVLPVVGKEDTYIAMFDKWNKTNLIDSCYIWMPVQFKENNEIEIAWQDSWEL